MRGGVLRYAAQAGPQFDAEIAEKDHLWMETNWSSSVIVYANERPHKKTFSEKTCLAMLRKMSVKAFDPKVVDAFFSSLDHILQVKRDLSESCFF